MVLASVILNWLLLTICTISGPNPEQLRVRIPTVNNTLIPSILISGFWFFNPDNQVLMRNGWLFNPDNQIWMRNGWFFNPDNQVWMSWFNLFC